MNLPPNSQVTKLSQSHCVIEGWGRVERRWQWKILPADVCSTGNNIRYLKSVLLHHSQRCCISGGIPCDPCIAQQEAVICQDGSGWFITFWFSEFRVKIIESPALLADLLALQFHKYPIIYLVDFYSFKPEQPVTWMFGWLLCLLLAFRSNES